MHLYSSHDKARIADCGAETQERNNKTHITMWRKESLATGTNLLWNAWQINATHDLSENDFLNIQGTIQVDPLPFQSALENTTRPRTQRTRDDGQIWRIWGASAIIGKRFEVLTPLTSKLVLLYVFSEAVAQLIQKQIPKSSRLRAEASNHKHLPGEQWRNKYYKQACRRKVLPADYQNRRHKPRPCTGRTATNVLAAEGSNVEVLGPYACFFAVDSATINQ
jgi:hypothetical protein